MKPSGCLESSSATYPVMQRHIAEEQRQLLCCQSPKACNIKKVKYFCTCVANHSFGVLCSMLMSLVSAGFMAGNWKCKSEVDHGVLQLESGFLVL
jgi:hypothetical protein